MHVLQPVAFSATILSILMSFVNLAAAAAVNGLATPIVSSFIPQGDGNKQSSNLTLTNVAECVV